MTVSTADNKLTGNGGDDVLTGGLGRDHLRGNAGNDTLFSRDGVAGFLDGGSGAENAQRNDSLDFAPYVEAFLSRPRRSPGTTRCTWLTDK